STGRRLHCCTVGLTNPTRRPTRTAGSERWWFAGVPVDLADLLARPGVDRLPRQTRSIGPARLPWSPTPAPGLLPRFRSPSWAIRAPAIAAGGWYGSAGWFGRVVLGFPGSIRRRSEVLEELGVPCVDGVVRRHHRGGHTMGEGILHRSARGLPDAELPVRFRLVVGSAQTVRVLECGLPAGLRVVMVEGDDVVDFGFLRTARAAGHRACSPLGRQGQSHICRDAVALGPRVQRSAGDG